jgi:hypothetical protein
MEHAVVIIFVSSKPAMSLSNRNYTSIAGNLQHPRMGETRALLWPRRYQSPAGYAPFKFAPARLSESLCTGTPETCKVPNGAQLGGDYPGVVRLIESGSPVFYLKKPLAADLLNTEPPADEDIHAMEWPHPAFLLFVPTMLGIGYDIILLAKLAKGETVGMDWPGIDGRLHRGERHVMPADICQVTCWNSQSDKSGITSFIGIDGALHAMPGEFKTLSAILAQQNPLDKKAILLAVNALFFLMATKPSSTARISRPAKCKPAKSLTELWEPNVLGLNYLADAEVEEAQLRQLAAREGMPLHQIRKSPRLHWRRAHWRRPPGQAKQAILIRRQLIGLHRPMSRDLRARSADARN